MPYMSMCPLHDGLVGKKRLGIGITMGLLLLAGKLFKNRNY